MVDEDSYMSIRMRNDFFGLRIWHPVQRKRQHDTDTDTDTDGGKAVFLLVEGVKWLYWVVINCYVTYMILCYVCINQTSDAAPKKRWRLGCLV